MKNVFIIHGAYGTPRENWFPWLKEKCESKGCEVYVPQFPTPENQSLESWTGVFDGYLDKVNENTIFVGHSLAPAFILSILERINYKVSACFFVAGFVGLLNDELDEINRTIIDRNFDWERIRNNCSKFYVFNSNNDPYISMEKAEGLAQHLDTDVIEVKGAGHFNKKAGYTTFEELWKKLEPLL